MLRVEVSRMYSTILVPLDGSALSERAIPHARDLALKYGAEITLLRATALPDRVYALPDLTAAAYMERYRETEQEAIRDYLKTWKERLEADGIVCHVSHRLDDAAAAIVDQAEVEDIDLIVMSTHGRGGLDRWVHGSVASKVLRHAPCPLLLIRVSPATEANPIPATRQAAAAGT